MGVYFHAFSVTGKPAFSAIVCEPGVIIWPIVSVPSKDHRRPGDRRLVTGAGSYVSDLADSRTLHAWFARSPLPHALLDGVETAEAAAVPGAAAVFTAADLDLDDIPGNTGRGPQAPAMTRPPLVRERARFVGDPIAAAIARTAPAAEDAAGLVWPILRELPPVLDPRRAEDGPPLFAGGNVVMEERLAAGEDPGPGRASAVVEIGGQRLAPSPLEPVSILVRPEGDGLRVWCGHQAPHRLRGQLAAGLGMEPDLIRVTVPQVGGAFGMKGMLFPEYLVVAAAARRLGRPVLWTASRREQFIIGTHGRAQRYRAVLEGDADGRLRRLRLNVLAEVGAYPHNGSQIPLFSRLVATGLYDIPRLEVETKVVVTNTAPTGSYRGAGRPEAALAVERVMDVFARRLGLDPIEVRLRNMIPPQNLPWRTPAGARYDSGDYPRALRRVAKALDLPALREEKRRRRERGGPLLGAGAAAFVERAGGAPDSSEYARVEADPRRREITVRTGSVDTGQGHARVWRNLAAGIFQTGPVRVIAGDTALVAEGTGSFASRSAQLGASAVARASRRVLERARRRAAGMLEADPADLRYREGVFRVAGDPASGVSLWETASPEPLAAEDRFSAGAQTFPYGVHAAVVEADPATGEIRLLRVIALDDCGTVLDPMIVEGQTHGSLAQGLGEALLEDFRYDADGQPVTSTFMDYPLPTAAEAPSLTILRMTSPAPSNPLGVKGAGEAGCIGLPPAVLNAAADALWPLGVRHLDLPLTPHRVWRAIRDASRTANDCKMEK